MSLLLGPPAEADILVTAEGESLSGNLSRIADGILVFRTSLRGQMMVPTSEVRSLKTEGRWIVTLDGGDVHIGRFAGRGIDLDGHDGRDGVVVSVDHADVVSAKQAPPLPGTDPAAWRQQFSLGAQAHVGSGDSVAPFVQYDLDGQGPRGTLELRMRFDVPDGGMPPDVARGELELTPERPGAWRPFLRGDFARDRHEALSWRTGLAVGLRHDFSPRGTGQTTGYLGVAGIYSQWRDPDAATWFVPRGSEGTTALGLQAGLAHRQPVGGAAQWDSRLTLSPGTAPRSDFRAEAETALTLPLTSQLRLRFDAQLAYEDEPVFETLRSLGANLGASVQFEF